MDDFASRTIINGNKMRSSVGKTVSIMVHVAQEAEKHCRSFRAKTTDNVDLDVVLSEPLNTNVKGWIEVIGVPSAHDTIRNNEIILFPDENDDQFDKDAYNNLVIFMHQCKDIIPTSNY